MARQIISDGFHGMLSRPELFDLLRMHSNLVVSSRQDVLYCKTKLQLDDPTERLLMDMLAEPWRLYIGMLWGIEADNEATVITRDDLCYIVQFDTPPNSEVSKRYFL